MNTQLSENEGVLSIRRPDSRLLAHYFLRSLFTGPGFPFVFAYLCFRYNTLRYRFDEEGISMGWGALFHREVHLTYSRIQDIHLSSGVIERYLGLARIQIQTASGKAGAEMTIEGVLEFQEVRDFIYQRMRGLKDQPSAPTQAPLGHSTPYDDQQLVAALAEVTSTLRELRSLLEERSPRKQPTNE
ncbi:MAG: PH domain-containing protein [bacterium]|nr:PH domain-containing protein [bacterium]